MSESFSVHKYYVMFQSSFSAIRVKYIACRKLTAAAQFINVLRILKVSQLNI
jgi:hypothetical protein